MTAWREKKQWVPLDLTGRLVSWPGSRRPDLYIAVAGQFDVEANPRYRREEDGRTWCNIYVWDVTRALQAEVPHWVGPDMRPASMGAVGATEQTANEMVEWLRAGRGGWRSLRSREEAFETAQTGRPVVVGWRSPLGQIGHVAMVLPWSRIAQAGRTNLFSEPLERGFGALKELEFFGHD